MTSIPHYLISPLIALHIHHTPHTHRRGELSGLQPYIPTDRLAAPGSPVVLAGVPVHEQGPLARCAPFMDTAARRVLPGHLLRRARVLSSLQVRDTRVTAVHVTSSVTGQQQQHAINAVQAVQGAGAAMNCARYMSFVVHVYVAMGLIGGLLCCRPVCDSRCCCVCCLV